eukprot:Rhum_TRINITY_DN8041_c0_g1::Rhum_TRINITY_DN8041_c0_g1_i1::g.25721::m.25721/K11481/AURKA; aurora kinase A
MRSYLPSGALSPPGEASPCSVLSPHHAHSSQQASPSPGPFSLLGVSPIRRVDDVADHHADVDAGLGGSERRTLVFAPLEGEQDCRSGRASTTPTACGGTAAANRSLGALTGMSSSASTSGLLSQATTTTTATSATSRGAAAAAAAVPAELSTTGTRTTVAAAAAGASVDASSSAAQAAGHRGWSMDDFVVGKRLGVGAYSKVYMAQERETGFVVALKAVRRRDLHEKALWARLDAEVRIHRSLDHRNIVSLYGCFSDRHRVCLAVEYCPGGSVCALIPGGGLAEPAAAVLLVQLVAALGYLHGRGFVHRDVKPENLLIDKDGVLRLCDMGWTTTTCAAALQPPPPSTSTLPSPSFRRYTVCGTLDYMAPELLSEALSPHGHGTPVDLWALGVVAHELLTAATPFYHKSASDTRNAIVGRDYHAPRTFSARAAAFVAALLQKREAERPDVTWAAGHDFLVPGGGSRAAAGAASGGAPSSSGLR